MAKIYVPTTCTRDCPNTCGLLATVENGRVIKLVGNPDQPINQGRSCIKCTRYLDRLYHKERVLHPLKKRNGRFERIGWEDAMDEIAARIKRVVAEKGAEAILYYQGFGARTALKLVNRRFFNHLGPTTVLKGTLCGGTGQASQDLDFGERISHDPRDYHNSASMLVWGRNPAASGLNIVPGMQSVKKRGGQVILIDPVDTESVKLCTVHIKPRPNTDAYLALAASRLLHEWGAEDRAFLTERCEGYEEYKELVFSHTVGEYAALCDVPIEQIRLLAETLRDQKPTGIVLGWGLHRWEYAHTTLRCVDALGAAAGCIGVSGGGVSQGFEEYAPYDWDVYGDALQLPDRRKFLMPVIGEELLNADPPIELAVVTAGNPIAMAPNANKVREAFERIPYLVVAGHFLDDTAQLADIFLPATSLLEEKDVVASYGHNFIGPLNPCVPPMGECHSDFELFMDLGKRFDFANEYVKPLDEWLEIIMAPTLKKGVKLEDIFKGGVNCPDAPDVPYADGLFPTPTGKFRLITEFELPEGRDREYPYQLMSLLDKSWLCSELTLEEQQGGPLPVRINRQEGEKLGLKDGAPCIVENQFGELLCTARLEDGLRPDLVAIPRGGWGQAGRNVNVLTRDLVSVVGDGTPYFEARVRVRPV